MDNRDAFGESIESSNEVIWEIFNKCPRNQMRDVFVEEVEIEDPEEYIKRNSREKRFLMTKQFLTMERSSLTLLQSQINRDVPLQKFRKCGIIQVQDCRYYIAIMQSVNPYRDET